MSRGLATLSMLALHASLWAGPVPATEADTAAAASTLTAPMPRGLSDVAPVDAVASGPSGSVLAAEIIKEAGAGAAEDPRSAQRTPSRAPAAQAAATTVVSKRAGADDDPWGLRDTGKAALRWIKDAVPWLRRDDDAADGELRARLNDSDASSILSIGRAGRETSLATPPPPHTIEDPLSTVGYGESARPKALAAEENLVRTVINILREVLEHPMTWLVVALFAIGGVAVKKFDRRPTK